MYISDSLSSNSKKLQFKKKIVEMGISKGYVTQIQIQEKNIPEKKKMLSKGKQRTWMLNKDLNEVNYDAN